MSFFSRKVEDPDLCFCQSVVLLMAGLSYVTTDIALRAIVKGVLVERNISDIFYDNLERLKGVDVKECYSSDRSVLLNQAEALFEITAKVYDYCDDNGKGHCLNALSVPITKMRLSRFELEPLIIKYFLPVLEKLDESISEQKKIKDWFMNNMLNIFMTTH